VEFAVADIKDIKWSSLPYDCLSISDEQRDVIMALVEARLNPSMVFDDFVAGKGKGLNMLLQYGPSSGHLSQCTDVEKWPTRSWKNFDSRSSI
tara:strand:+ start:173 stop:451 length:279 start_codon:yes stop_codon:yes gene_type:complete